MKPHYSIQIEFVGKTLQERFRYRLMRKIFRRELELILSAVDDQQNRLALTRLLIGTSVNDAVTVAGWRDLARTLRMRDGKPDPYFPSERVTSNRERLRTIGPDGILMVVNEMWDCLRPKPKYKEFNQLLPGDAAMLEKLEAEIPIVGLTDFSPTLGPWEGTKGISLLSMIATLTDGLCGLRLAAVVEDDGTISRWGWQRITGKDESAEPVGIEGHIYPDTEADGVVFCGKCGKPK